MIMVVITFLLLLVSVLVGVAFLTLLERKVLGYIHIRKGPNKVGFVGLLQPFSDAIKLFTKEQSFPIYSNMFIFYLSPAINFVLALILWCCIPFYTFNLSFSFSLLFMLSVSSLGVYTIMLAGWSSNSNYALLGSLRSVAQIISYEVSLFLILLSFIFLIGSFNLYDFSKYQENIWFGALLFPLVLMLMVSLLAETNRTPFDFAEGESELVSGFNVEYSSGGFALIFLAEYASILFMSMLGVYFFLGGDLNSVFFFFKVVVLAFFWIWVRGTLPRYRYDKLMNLAWCSYLPASLMLLMFYFGLMSWSKIFIN
uniref:NADH-ubiquinone oxidoreductase chain 1 n=1 Tax=Pityophthorus pubescens TaxID=471227 RepID=A0A343A6I3_9CUCU|nr:NADH dehydrogenase subunit 1 [Pityophthorus pubescens]AOY40162.1 NADH dehydrogenase subunit 1 [Pityophthorus pubescens]